MTTIGENALTTCRIPDLHYMIAASRGQAFPIRRPGHGPDVTHMTLNCIENAARCGIANLSTPISISQSQALAIRRPRHTKDTGIALRSQECSSQRDMHSLISSDSRYIES